MEKRTLTQRLALAESRVQYTDSQVTRQRALLKHLERHSLGTFHARKLLRELEGNKACFTAYRDQLRSEMVLPAPAGVIEDRPSAPAIQKQAFSDLG